MPTPVGHALGGLAVYLLGERRQGLGKPLATAAVATALAPDLDFALGPLLGGNYHHYFTHSVGFLALFAAAVYLVSRYRGRPRPRQDALLLGAAYGSHILLDLLAKDTSPPFGVELFWPLSKAFVISPVVIFDDIWRGDLATLLGLHNWLAVAREIAILGPLVLVLAWPLWTSVRQRARHSE